MTAEIIRVDEGSTDTPSDDLPTRREWLEAKARHLMTRCAATPDAWPHRTERAALLKQTDAALDQFNEAPR